MLVAAWRFVGRLALVLRYRRRVARLDQIDRLDHRVYAHRKERVEINRADGVGLRDRHALLNEDRSGVDALVGPEPRHSRFRVALDDRPVDAAGAAMAREQGRVKANRLVARRVENPLGDYQGDEGQDGKVGVQRFEMFEGTV